LFLGHFGLGFVAKRWAPKASLGTILLAAQLLDLLWPVALLTGVELVVIDPSSPSKLAFVHYPYTHSLLFVLLWAALFAAAHYAYRKDRKTALVLGALVVSHWFLDLLVHAPDLPLLPSGPFVGFGLWNFFWVSFIVEMALFAIGVLLYTSSAKYRKGWLGALVLLLLLSHAANIFGPAPPSVQVVAWAGNLQWLFILFAYRVDIGLARRTN
jgi:membrane-bound metal-dependent hydrolase YbcI (DUF457 family)